jgi:hypothetical protein
MRSIKHISLSIIITLSVFGAVLYTSCSKSGCKGVTCLNGGVCSGGICQCPNTVPGIGGNNCEIVYRDLYKNSYTGFASYIDSNNNIIRFDSLNTLTFNHGNDSNYNKMQMTWTRTGGSSANSTITLSNFTSTGSNFTVSAFTIDSFNCTGTGSISANTVSLNLIAKPPYTHSIVITLNNFSRR